MNKIKEPTKSFKLGLQKLGFQNDNALFFITDAIKIAEPEIAFHIETATFIHKETTAIFLRKQLNGSYKPQVYLFDFSNRAFSEQIENEIANIQSKIWSSGEVPLACFFFNTEIKIIDCTKHLTKEFKPTYLINTLLLADEVHNIYNNQLGVKIVSGMFWEQDEIKEKFDFKNSSYDTLILNISKVTKKLSLKLYNTPKLLINKIIIQSILIKYLEETADDEGRKLLTDKYFKKYSNSNSFSDVLKKGKFSDLLDDLNTNFNGNVFKWQLSEQKQLQTLDLNELANLLATDKTNIDSSQLEFDFLDWRYFEFKYIPVELISRLYEEFLGENKKEKGLFYTPSHLAKLLVDECLPLKKYKDIDPNEFTILDPACGSGIFLVTAFKRLVQIWRLRNHLNQPSIQQLKNILHNIYGVDKEEQAVMLSSFSLSLALCNELKPIERLTKLKFDDLTKENLSCKDFFVYSKIKFKKFDLIIGNPPFARGAISEYSNFWNVNNEKVNIPQGQIALKFLSESFTNLKNNGLVCLIIKASGLLYNTTSIEYKKALFTNYDVVQFLDFTALARNKSLWDNDADVATAAIFVRNSKPDASKNILHLTFKRTKATKNRIIFEIDDYDLHFVNRQDALSNSFIWKNNLLGGGRIKNTVEKFQQYPLLQEVLNSNNYISGEGYIEGTKGKKDVGYLKKYPTLPTNGITAKGINYDTLSKINFKSKFVQIPNETLFKAPNILLWENIGVDKLPVFYNEKAFTFKDKVVSIATENIDKSFLKKLINSFNKYSHFYRFYIFSTSSQVLVNLNTAILKKDYMSLRFVLDNKLFINSFSNIDEKIVEDVNTYTQDFLRHGEKSKALQKIRGVAIFESFLFNYGTEFSKALNSVYESNGKKFRLTEVINLEGASLIATVFRYDNKANAPIFLKDFTELNIEGLTNNQVSLQLSIKRIIKLYPQKDMIVFVKPNQYRYWLSSIAYRDADKCFSDFTNQIEE